MGLLRWWFEKLFFYQYRNSSSLAHAIFRKRVLLRRIFFVFPMRFAKEDNMWVVVSDNPLAFNFMALMGEGSMASLFSLEVRFRFFFFCYVGWVPLH
jgi:hypothetical protein